MLYNQRKEIVMKNAKTRAIRRELSLFARYNQIDGTVRRLLTRKNLTANEQIVKDYFCSHVDDDGECISLETYLTTHPNTDKTYLSQVNSDFLSLVFKKSAPVYFFDVDNTLTENGVLSSQKAEFLRSFDSSRVVLSTGKAFDAISQTATDCGLTDGYFSCLNGSVVKHGDSQTQLGILGGVSKKLLKTAKTWGIEYLYYYPDGAYATSELLPKNFASMNTYDEFYKINPHIDYKNIVKLLFFIYDGETEKENLVKQLTARFKGLVCMRTGHHCYEILRKNQHKGVSVKYICNKLGVYYRATVGVGDSMNDLKLLDYVGAPFVVCDASNQLKSFGFRTLDGDRQTDIVKLMKEYK